MSTKSSFTWSRGRDFPRNFAYIEVCILSLGKKPKIIISLHKSIRTLLYFVKMLLLEMGRNLKSFWLRSWGDDISSGNPNFWTLVRRMGRRARWGHHEPSGKRKYKKTIKQLIRSTKQNVRSTMKLPLFDDVLNIKENVLGYMCDSFRSWAWTNEAIFFNIND